MKYQTLKIIGPSAFVLMAGASHGTVSVIDQGGVGYSETGVWVGQAGTQGLNGDWRYQGNPATDETATYDFTGLSAGKYLVSTPSFAQGNLSSNATWALSDGGGSVNVNQQVRTTHFNNDAGTTFQRLGVGTVLTPLSITDGTFTGSLSDNDAGGFLIADALRLERVRMDVMNIRVIDNGGPGYAETLGSWSSFGELGDYGTDFRFASLAQVTATFSGLDAGFYRVSTAWTGGGNRATDVSLSYATTGAMGSMSYSQIPGAAADDTFEEVNWQDMFSDVPVTDGTLTLTLDNTAGGLLIADGFRLEMTGVIPEPSSVVLIAFSGLALLRRRRN